MRGRGARWIGLGGLAWLAACAADPGVVTIPPEVAEARTGTGAVSPSGFGEVTMVTLAPGVFPVATAFDTSQPDLVVAGGQYAVRRVAADRVRIGFAPMIERQPDGSEISVPAPPAFITEPTIRVGGTEGIGGTSNKLEAVLVVLAFCGRPVPVAEELYRWGDEPVTRAGDTGEWQFTGLC